MPFGDDERVGGSLWINVGEGYGVLVFVDFLGGNFSGGDFAEDAIHGVHANAALMEIHSADVFRAPMGHS